MQDKWNALQRHSLRKLQAQRGWNSGGRHIASPRKSLGNHFHDQLLAARWTVLAAEAMEGFSACQSGPSSSSYWCSSCWAASAEWAEAAFMGQAIMEAADLD